MSLQEMIVEVQKLSQQERKQLMHVLVDMMDDSSLDLDEDGYSKKSLLDFYGLGAHAYDGTDAQEYVNQLRAEWDDRP